MRWKDWKLFRSGVSFERVGDEGVIVDIDTNKVVTLNRTGADIVEVLMRGDSLEAAISHVSSKYNADLELVQKDANTLIEALVEHGVWNT